MSGATTDPSPGLHKHWRHHGYEWWTSDLLGHDGGNECPACGEPADLIEEERVLKGDTMSDEGSSVSDLTERARLLLADIAKPTVGLSALIEWRLDRVIELVSLVPALLNALEEREARA